MTFHMCCVILATASEPERKRANFSMPQNDRKIHTGISMLRATAQEIQAVLVISVCG